jgi:hypothetical protein
MNINDANSEFVTELYRVAVEDAEKDFFEQMAMPPSRRNDEWQQFIRWFAEQDESTKAMVKFAVQESVIGSAYNVCILFDGSSGYWEGQGKVGEFKVQLDVYDNYDMIDAKTLSEHFLIDPNETNEEMHDIFLSLVDVDFP